MENNETLSATENSTITSIAPEEDKGQELEAELFAAKDKILRLAAEAENIRKRAAKEVNDAKNYAITGFAKEILPVCDSLERALETAKSLKKENENNNNFISLLTGMEMTQSILLKVLQNMQVKKIISEGAMFDPNFHQAMFEVPIEESEQQGKIANVIQDGYTIGDRVLRPALVGITKHK